MVVRAPRDRRSYVTLALLGVRVREPTDRLARASVLAPPRKRHRSRCAPRGRAVATGCRRDRRHERARYLPVRSATSRERHIADTGPLPDNPKLPAVVAAAALSPGQGAPVKMRATRTDGPLRREDRHQGRLDRRPRRRRARAHRSERLRQEHVPALAQPDERHGPGRLGRRTRRARRRAHLRPGRRPGARAPARRDGLPALEPVPEVDLRERRLRPAHRRRAASTAASPSGSSARCGTRRCGTR